MISHKHRTVFIHIPKCAGQSVEMAFLADHGLDWDSRAPLLLRANDDPALGPPRLAHLTAEDYIRCGHLSAEEFAEFYSFAVVRHPWARAVSLYRHLEPNVTFSGFVRDWLPRALNAGAAQRWFVRPQTEFVLRDGKIGVTDLLSFESLAQDFPQVAQRAGLVAPLPHANRSGARTRPDVQRPMSAVKRLGRALLARLRPRRFETHPRWRDYYGPADITGIAQLYASDCETFGYVFDRDERRP